SVLGVLRGRVFPDCFTCSFRPSYPQIPPLVTVIAGAIDGLKPGPIAGNSRPAPGDSAGTVLHALARRARIRAIARQNRNQGVSLLIATPVGRRVPITLSVLARVT